MLILFRRAETGNWGMRAERFSAFFVFQPRFHFSAVNIGFSFSKIGELVIDQINPINRVK
jgi:hypothetical protein